MTIESASDPAASLPDADASSLPDPGAETPMRGQSGYCVRPVREDFILKSSGTGPADRLKKQYLKQKGFKLSSPRFAVCESFDPAETVDGFSFKMRWHRLDSATQFIDKARPGELHRFAADLAALVDEFVSESPTSPADPALIVNTSRLAVERIRAKGFLPGIDELARPHLHQAGVLRFALPLGKCHGDLTFSNILFDARGGRHILIDFLDAYMESPLLDLAKIRQETKLYWSSIFSGESHDKAKFRIAMRRIEERIEAHFAAQPYYSPAIDFFEFQNLLRVLPYASDPFVIESIHSRLIALRKESP